MTNTNENNRAAKYMESQVSKLRDKWDECASALFWSREDWEEVVDVRKLGKANSNLSTALRLHSEIEAEVMALSGVPLTQKAQAELDELKEDLEDLKTEHDEHLELHKCLEILMTQIKAA